MLFPYPSRCLRLGPQFFLEVSIRFGVGTSIVCSVDIGADAILPWPTVVPLSLTSPLTLMSDEAFLSGCLLFSFLFICVKIFYSLLLPGAAFCLFSNIFSQRRHHLSQGVQLCSWICPLEPTGTVCPEWDLET